MNREAVVWNPKDEIWHSGDVQPELDNLDPRITDLINRVNQLEHEQVMTNLPEVRTTANGLSYTLSSEGQPVKEAMIFLNAWAAPLSPERPLGNSNRIKADYAYRLFKETDIVEYSGNPLPVISVAGAHRGNRMTGIPAIEDGDFSVLATVISREIFQEVPELESVYVSGHSLGAQLAADVVSAATSHLDVEGVSYASPEVHGVGYLDPANQERSVIDLAKAQLASNPGDDYRRGGYAPLLRVHQLHPEQKTEERFAARLKRDVAGVLDKIAQPNIRIVRGLAKGTFDRSARDAVEATQKNRPIPHLAGRGLRSQVSAEGEITGVSEIHIKERHHGWPEDMQLYGQFMLDLVLGKDYRPQSTHSTT